MNQPALFHESLQDALSAVIAVLGGAKVVGAQLWPEKPADEAGRLLRHCLNPERPEKLSLEQLLLILREARKANAHAAIDFIAQTCGYQEPDPIEAESEAQYLQREFIQAVRTQEHILKRLEALHLPVRAVK